MGHSEGFASNHRLRTDVGCEYSFQNQIVDRDSFFLCFYFLFFIFLFYFLRIIHTGYKYESMNLVLFNAIIHG